MKLYGRRDIRDLHLRSTSPSPKCTLVSSLVRRMKEEGVSMLNVCVCAVRPSCSIITSSRNSCFETLRRTAAVTPTPPPSASSASALTGINRPLRRREGEGEALLPPSSPFPFRSHLKFHTSPSCLPFARVSAVTASQVFGRRPLPPE